MLLRWRSAWGRGSAEFRDLVRPRKRDKGAYGAAHRGQRGNGGASNCTARAACWGMTPLPSAVSCAGRPRPGVAVTQPAGRPCIHSTKSARRRPAASVGGGAGRVSVSHRAMAASYGPHRPSLPPRPGPFPPTAAGPPLTGAGAGPCPDAGRGVPVSLALGLGRSEAAAVGSVRSPLPCRWFGEPLIPSDAFGVGSSHSTSSARFGP